MNAYDLSVDFTIENDLIRCGKSLHFPRACIFTGETDGLESKSATVFYCPIWVFILVPFTFGIATLLYALIRKRCEIVYYVSLRAKRVTNWKRYGGTLLLFLGLLGFVYLFLNDAFNQLLMLIAAAAMLVGAIVAMSGENCPIKAVKADHAQFWLRGCRPPFFNQIRTYRS
jgi:hypothetical protein